eukprot:Plantae.Rhodophyta-Purpureofilum_apyrenoidigerum.ctg5383.p1 GENE.Plantae.Rhodophyta-Purpureofilum_apyrenoidigerum.ctg5383~~Plantae.Rhodophyta-Purpureofilum_apyrenoidigerum.ctg5383.p1  ORF type:complete len:204 (+),score=34.28 Plantae.Rhodophyta-Purpureofilum_apyrenoidigerum.ctg5383:90-701(+)
MMSMMRRAVVTYGKLLQSHPITTKSVSACALAAAADLVVQKSNGGKIDYVRTARFCSYSLIFGALGHHWYRIAEKVFQPTRSTAGLMKSVAIDQFLFSPFVNGGLFAYVVFLEGKGMQGVKAKLKADWATTVANSWLLWLPTQIVNFRYVPESYRLLVVSAVAFVWNIYLAVVTAKVVVQTVKEVETAKSTDVQKSLVDVSAV